MPEPSAPRDIHTGDVSGVFVVGDNNQVTHTSATTTPRSEQPEPEPEPGPEAQPQQSSTARDRAAVFAVTQGDLHVTYHAAEGD